MRSRTGAWLPLAGLVLTVVIWAGNNVVSKLILAEASPLLTALVRFTLAGCLFHLPVFLALHRGDQRFGPSEWPRVLLLGSVGVAGSLVLSLLGLKTTPATDAAIYNLTTPLFVLILAWLWFGERLTPSRVAGIAAAFTGAAVLAVGGSVGLSGGDLQGALFLLANAVIWSGYTLWSRDVIVRRSPLLVLSAVNLVAMLMIWPSAILLGALSELPAVVHWTPRAWWAMAYLVLLMSVASQFLYILSIRDLRPSQVSALLYTGPFFTALISAVTLAELPTTTTIAAGLLILLGVSLVNRRAATTSPRPEPPRTIPRIQTET